MTGYGVGTVKAEEGECLVEIKSLNNKYCDINTKNNFQSLEIEQKIEKLIKNRISRGKVNILVKVENNGLTEEKIILNEDVADSCYKNLKTLKKKYKLKDEISIDSMLKFKDIFKIVKEEESGKIWPLVEKATNLALDSLLKMREREGKVLVADIRKRFGKIQKLIGQVEKYSKSSPLDYKDKFLSKIKNLTNGLNIDEGRKMDFLTQEINREVNTIGSKTNDIKVTSLVVLVKSELEKIKEQARNI